MKTSMTTDELLAYVDELRAQILGFPNLTMMREAMVAAADENEALRAELAALKARLAEAEALLREARAGDQLHWKRWRAWQAEVDAFLAETAPAALSAEEHCKLFCAWKGGGPCLADDCPRRKADQAPAAREDT